jgi:signal transduction histidine kinase
MSKVLNWVAKRYWWIIIFVSLLILFWDVLEAILPQTRSLLGMEFILCLTLLLFIGRAFDFSSRKILAQTQTLKILDYKHRLSQEFSSCTDWDVLINFIACLPGTIAEVEHSYLFVPNSISDDFECVAQWDITGQEETGVDSAGICRRYLNEKTPNSLKFGQCEDMSRKDTTLLQAQEFCLPIQYGGSQLGILQFRLMAEKTLMPEQFEIFENIGEEIAIALKIWQKRKASDEMSSTRAALDERRTVSHYLHDNLGQNLGYVHFKLGQLISEIDQLSKQELLNEFGLMLNAANESYEIVRGTLETIHVETTPLLTNLLIEHARRVAQRANFEIAFKTTGRPISIPANVQRAIFYVFQETLRNVEKHARASKVDVCAEWAEDHFELSILDDGIGFNAQAVNTDHHFGLEIMRERMEKVKGRVILTISKKTGTHVNIWVPTQSMRQLRGANG